MKKIILACAIVATSAHGMQGENFYYLYNYMQERASDFYALISPSYKRKRILDTLMRDLNGNEDMSEKEHLIRPENNTQKLQQKLCCFLCIAKK